MSAQEFVTSRYFNIVGLILNIIVIFLAFYEKNWTLGFLSFLATIMFTANLLRTPKSS